MALWLSLLVDVVSMLLRFVLGFYAFWLVLRALEGLLSESRALRELDPLACAFTDPFVQPVSRVTRLPDHLTCWAWLVALAIVQVGLERVPALV